MTAILVQGLAVIGTVGAQYPELFVVRFPQMSFEHVFTVAFKRMSFAVGTLEAGFSRVYGAYVLQQHPIPSCVAEFWRREITQIAY